MEAGGGLTILFGLVLLGFLFARMDLFNKFGGGNLRHTEHGALEKTAGRLNLHHVALDWEPGLSRPQLLQHFRGVYPERSLSGHGAGTKPKTWHRWTSP